MIFVCEPQCTGHSHEKVNSGFLSTLAAAYPGETIRLYADASHYRGLLEVLARDGIAPLPLEHRTFVVGNPLRIVGAWSYYRQLQTMLRDTVAAGVGHVFFLSGSPIIHHLVKRLKASPELGGLRFTFVLHGSFEEIAERPPVAASGPSALPTQRSFLQRLRAIEPMKLPGLVMRVAHTSLSARYTAAWARHLREKDQLLWRHSADFRYIALARHVRANAAQYLDVDALDIHAVDMPINFAPVAAAPDNDHLKIATFGYGDAAGMRQLAALLAERELTRPYEIRIIGMDNSGLEGYPNIYCPSPGKPLSRADMERHAAEMDAFLILYGKDRYRLSCSGTIFEAISYCKPALHIGNPSVTQFESEAAPIGFQRDDLAALADLIADMVNDYPRYRPLLAERRANLIALRQRLSIAERAPALRRALGLPATPDSW